MKEFDVIVIGGGMVGLAFAIELSQKKIDSAIQKFKAKFRSPSSYDAFKRRFDIGEDKIRTMSCGSQDAPPVARLVDRAEVGRRVPYLDRPFGLEPHERSSRE